MLTRLQHALELALFSLLLASLFTSSSAMPGDTTDRVRAYTRPVEFDYFDWTLDAFGVKLSQAALGTPFYFHADDRRQIVMDYLKLVAYIGQDEYHLNLVYTDPSVRDPEAASTGLRAELDILYARQAELAPLAEAILQEQIGAVLADLGLTTSRQPIPPILFHISPLPYELIVSRRDKIERIASVSLLPELTVNHQAALEEQVDAGLDVSSLVVPVGGIGSYPTMVMRTTALDWLADTIAHEWIHNWLTLRPLGLNYDASPELRTMNETTASIAGHEIALLFLQRYYPEFLPQAARPQTAQIDLPMSLPGSSGFNDQPFDFRAEMYETRVTVDRLLTEGKIEEAEAYMEERRLLFWENGYAIRKLNQAYFAFYGAYADVPGGAAGEDPVGPAVRALRAQSASLAEFLHHIAQMTSFEELQATLAR